MPQDQCIYNLLKTQAGRIPNSVAIAGIDGKPLTYGQLYAHIEDIGKRLNDMGVGRNNRVAVVLSNGPEMASAFLAIGASATIAPLNPAYQEREFQFYLSDLNAKALIIEAGLKSPAIDVANSSGINVITLSSISDGETGIFELKGDKRRQPFQSGFAQPDDVALVLHTSGTTSRPKIVPLSHTNICTSANNIKATLNLTENDRCINIMPLFHIHGLIGAILSSISAGASIVCTPGFNAPKFLDWVNKLQPTWYTAVPTMHQSILARVDKSRDVKYPLRLIRSSSASLPPQVMKEMEDEFGVPVIESYGMTEATHQMASNLLPPGKRKPGSVGVAAGPEVAIMDESGNLLNQGEIGEIVIRGANVTQGYENNPEANEKAFTNGWFRTGDQGYFDKDNYLFITGRLKEIINRAGEKISPREVDAVLMQHEAIQQAVTFAIPHARLGEDIGAAIVLRKGEFPTERNIQEFVARQLVQFKVPRRVLILNEIPKGPTGKLQRIGLAEKLGLAGSVGEMPEFIAPRNPIERNLVEIWEKVIGISDIGIHDNFFEVGGDSILATQMLAKVNETYGRNIPITDLFQNPNVEYLAKIIEQKEPSSLSSLISIQPKGDKTPFFCIHGCLGEVLNYYALAKYIGQDQPVYALRARGMYGEAPPHLRIQDMAADYIKEIRKIQPEGYYCIGGSGYGGFIAFEIAQQLLAKGQKTELLVLMDTSFDDWNVIKESIGPGISDTRSSLPHFIFHSIWHLKFKELSDTFRSFFMLAFGYRPLARNVRFIRRFINYEGHVRSVLAWIIWNYIPKAYPGRILCFLSENREDELHEKWRELATGEIEVLKVPGHHTSMLQEPFVQKLAEHLREYLKNA